MERRREERPGSLCINVNDLSTTEENRRTIETDARHASHALRLLQEPKCAHE